MTANARAAAAACVVAVLAGCTAVFDGGQFVVAGEDASVPASSAMDGSSSGSRDGGAESGGGGTCTTGQMQCMGALPQTCVGGHWQNAVAPCGGPNPSCVAGACKPCSPGTRECQGLNADECSVVGEWMLDQVCSYVCDAGVCSGACAPNTTQCNGTEVDTCTAGVWQFSSQCTYTCINGACAGSCVPGTSQCTAAGTGVQICDSAGAWQTTMCADACDQGQCITGCVPGRARCNGPTTPQVCDNTGTWQTQTDCAQPAPDCDGGACTCEETACSTGCTDTTTDPLNCGACGNDCLGQPCSGGICQPLALATGQEQPWGIALGTSNCFWTNRGDGTVMTVAAAGGGTPTQVAASQNSPTTIATDAMNVYWVDTTNGGSVLECAFGGCTTPVVLASGQSSPWGITLPSAGGGVYFTAGSSAWSASFEDGGVAALGSESASAYPIVTDGSFVYWSDSVGAVYKCATTGCTTPIQLSGPAGQPSLGIAQDATNVYFTLGAVTTAGGTTAGSVWMASKAGAGATLMTSANSPVGVAVDLSTGFLYWTDIGNGTVTKMPTGDAGSPVTIAAAQSNPTSLVLDGTYVYWTNAIATTGSVMRMTK